MSASPMFSAACTATMLPLPPIHEPHSAPRPIQALPPMAGFMMRNAAMKPIMMVSVAEKKPSSIRGPRRSTLRMSHLSSIAKIIA